MALSLAALLRELARRQVWGVVFEMSRGQTIPESLSARAVKLTGSMDCVPRVSIESETQENRPRIEATETFYRSSNIDRRKQSCGSVGPDRRRG